MREFFWKVAVAIVVPVAGCASAPMPCPRVASPPVASSGVTTNAPEKKPGVVQLDAGVVIYDIAISDTAQIFHIADQLSQWSPFMHKQYMRWADENHVLGDPQKKALDAHRALRQRLHYGALDQNFYTTKSVQDALKDASANLSQDDLEIEKNLFLAMTPVLIPLIERDRKGVGALRDRIVAKNEELKSVLDDLVRFAEAYIPKKHVALWLVASTGAGSGGGGFNAEQMVLEDGGEPENVLMHESLHFVLDRKNEELALAAKNCGAGLDRQTLEEGLAYALSALVGKPGMLTRSLEQLASQGKKSDDPYVRYNRLGLALSPLLEKSLVSKTTLAAMLPGACDEWKKIAATAWP